MSTLDQAPAAGPYAAAPLPVAFVGGASGPWRVERVMTRAGDALPTCAAVDVRAGSPFGAQPSGPAAWRLSGFTSNMRYTTRPEADAMAPVTSPLGRSTATCAALIPIRKSSVWWAMTQDERRTIYQERSGHTSIGLEYMPNIARRLHHSRDLGEPFDFLTWFEFEPADASAFEDLLARLRATEEWRYVDREIDIRLVRAPPGEG